MVNSFRTQRTEDTQKGPSSTGKGPGHLVMAPHGSQQSTFLAQQEQDSYLSAGRCCRSTPQPNRDVRAHHGDEEAILYRSELRGALSDRQSGGRLGVRLSPENLS